ncbi:SRPBCC domain-containing protein [Pedobacter sp. P351]|uniref:SRPBCC family protein n=1 Tax=Pedobacter superstes TaxID=3133441 RepID=UPI0030AFB3B0
METKNKTLVVKDFNEKSILVSREFNAPLAKVWRAYTDRELLDQWWGPQPWRAETKRMDFKPGGHWLYAMVGPDNTKMWGIMNYISIDPLKRIDFEDAFCDENGNINPELPVSKSNTVFTETSNGVKVEFRMTYASAEDVRKLVEMGFEQGITTCFDQLESLLDQNKI